MAVKVGSKTRTVFGLTLGIIAGLALILLPGIIVLRTHPPIPSATDQPVMVPFTSYQELHSFIFTKSCNSTEVRNLYNPTPAPALLNTNANRLNPGASTDTLSSTPTSGTSPGSI